MGYGLVWRGVWMECETVDEMMNLVGAITARETVEDHRHDIASHCPKPGHFNAPIVHECKACVAVWKAQEATNAHGGGT